MVAPQELIVQLRAVFFEEATEGLTTLESGLLDLDGGSRDPELINAIFRAAHSIKGGAGTFGMPEVTSFTHCLETLLDRARSGKCELSSVHINAMLHAVDHLRVLLDAARSGGVIDAQRTRVVQAELEAAMESSGIGEAPAPVASPAPTVGPQRYQICFTPSRSMMRSGNDPYLILRALADLGTVETTLDAEALPKAVSFDPEQLYLAWKIQLTSSATLAQVREVFAWVEDDCTLEITQPSPAAAKKQQDSGSIRVNIDKVDTLINMVGELVITQSMLGAVQKDFDLTKLERLRQGLIQLERNTRELQDCVMRIRMLPIRFVFSRFPRMVHDLSEQLGKEIALTMQGEGTELDKTVLERIGDPLVHLVRNSIDHGVEMPDVRLARGKPAQGSILLEASHQGSNVVITVKDDGGGLNTEKILAKAKSKGLIPPDAQLSTAEIHELIFAPGFSTADTISDVSGRGVGMDVVRRNIHELGGRVDISSTPGKGSTFTIRLPLTLAILDGQVVRVGSQIFILPLVSIVESLKVQPKQLSTLVGKAELIRLRQDHIPIVRLHRVFNIEPDTHELAGRLLVIVEGDGQRVGLVVDDLLEQQQVVIKSLDTNYRRVGGVSGATILGDGTVALILDVAGVISLSRESKGDSWKISSPARTQP